MAYKKVLVDMDMDLNEIKNAVIHRLAVDPETPWDGQFWYNTTEKVYKIFDGVVIKAVGQVEFQVANDYLQYRQVGGDTWINVLEIPKLTYTQDFMNSDSVTVTHNLGRYPSVTVADTANSVYEVAVDYLDENSVLVSLNFPMSGKVFCN